MLPFTKKARDKLSNFKITDFSISLGYDRISSVLLGKEVPYDEETELYSYAASRLLLSYLNNPYITSKMAVFESKRVKHKIQYHIHELIEEFSIKLDNNKMDVFDYIRYSPRSPYYKLVNRDVNNGYVFVEQRDIIRILEEAIRSKLINIIPFTEKNAILEKYSSKLLSLLEKQKPKIKIKVKEHPPCIRAILERIKKHENLPHMARWVFAVYLISIGLSDEQILTFFAQIPDFNKKKTLYYLNHIRTMKYSMPSCSKIRSYGFCVSNCNVKNPLDLVKRR